MVRCPPLVLLYFFQYVDEEVQVQCLLSVDVHLPLAESEHFFLKVLNAKSIAERLLEVVP